MKKGIFLVLIFWAFSAPRLFSQEFMNGTFAYPGIWNAFEYFEGCSGYGQETYNFWFPQNKWWGSVKFVSLGLNYDMTIYPCISVSGEMNQIYWYDVLSMELTSPLTVGQKYKLVFDEKFNIDVPLTFESTYASQTYGNFIYTVPPHNAFLTEWRTRDFEFIATDSASFINVYIQQGPQLEYINASIGLNNFHLEQVNEDIVLSIDSSDPNQYSPSLQYDAYGLDGRLIYTQTTASDLPPGCYLLRRQGKVFRIVK
jgi:hypothetical protein